MDRFTSMDVSSSRSNDFAIAGVSLSVLSVQFVLSLFSSSKLDIFSLILLSLKLYFISCPSALIVDGSLPQAKSHFGNNICHSEFDVKFFCVIRLRQNSTLLFYRSCPVLTPSSFFHEVAGVSINGKTLGIQHLIRICI